MTDKQLNYKIQANVQGRESITDLARRLDDAAKVLSDDLAQAAQTAAAKLRELDNQDAAINAFNRLKSEARDSAQALKAAETEAANYVKEIGATSGPTAQQSAHMQRLSEATSAARQQFDQHNAALSESRQRLNDYGISSQNTQAAQARLRQEVEGVRQSVQTIAPAYQGAATGASAAGTQMVRTHRAIGEGVDSISQQLATMQKIYGAFAGLQGLAGMAKDVAATADEYNNLQARIKLVTGEGQAFASAWEQINQIALSTHTSLSTTGDLFTRIALAGKEFNLAQADALALTQTINQAVQLSGQSAQASDAAMIQLLQGLQSGVVRGEEFNSVMEQSPRLAKALADGLGVTTGELRKLAEAGTLTSDVVIKSLQGQAATVAGEFSKLPPTVGRALQDLSTSWTVYVGEQDKATGSSTLAAKAINTLAQNLPTVAHYLYDIGKAGAAYAALELAKHFTATGMAALTSAGQIAANTTATKAAAVGAEAAAVSTGRWASALGGLKTFALLAILTNTKEIGTAIGETIAKMVGYKDKSDEIARADKVAAEIMAQNAALRKNQIALDEAAANKQYDLSKAARKSIAEFEQLTKEGANSADAIAKIGKDFDLSSQKGIKDASGVLDALAAKGKITAEDFHQSWSEALKGEDLAKFEVQARAALNGTARESEKLNQVIDAVLRESIRRTGLDFDTLKGGMSKAAISAINDTDAMINGLDRLKAQGIDTAQALTASIGKGIQTADSQKAVNTLGLQIESLRGKLDSKVVDGLLDQLDKKVNDLNDELDKATPGVNSLREAFQELGLKSRDELTATAKRATEAYDTIMRAGQQEGESYTAWQLRKQAATQAMLEKQIAAQGGVATEADKSKAAMSGLEIQSDATGKAIVSAMNGGKAATQSLGDQVQITTEQLKAQQDALAAINDKYSRPGEGKNNSVLGSSDPTSDDNTGLSSLEEKKKAGTLSASDAATAQAVYKAAVTNYQIMQANMSAYSVEGVKSTQEAYIKARVILDAVNSLGNASKTTATTTNSSSSQTITINIPGVVSGIKVVDQSSADALIAALKSGKLAAGA